MTNVRVSALDLAAVKRAMNSDSIVTGRFDFNRDGHVNALDLSSVRANLNRTLGGIAPPAPAIAPAALAPATPFASGGSATTRVWDESQGELLG
jgi:hypothetical protein